MSRKAKSKHNDASAAFPILFLAVIACGLMIGWNCLPASIAAQASYNQSQADDENEASECARLGGICINMASNGGR